MKICSACSKSKEITEYYTKSSRCKSCHHDYNRGHYEANKEYYLAKALKRNAETIEKNRKFLIEYLLEHGCVDCGEDDLEVLEFDHRDASLKSYNIGSILNYKWETIQLEIEKCDVRCCNCHMRRTRRQFGWWMRD